MNIIQPEGNFFDKYNSQNIFVKRLMKGFFAAYENMLMQISYKTVLDAGCGEGYMSNFVYRGGHNLNL